MKLPLRLGLPLLGLLLVGLAVTDGGERFLLLVAAMGVALWSAFSLPHPGPKPEPRSLVEEGIDDGQPDDPERPPHGNGSGEPPRYN